MARRRGSPSVDDVAAVAVRHHALAVFLNMDEPRSLPRLAERLRVLADQGLLKAPIPSVPTLSRWSRQWGWAAACAAHDAEVHRRLIAQTAELTAEGKIATALRLETFANIAIDHALARLPAMSAGAAMSAAVDALKQAALMGGGPTERVAHTLEGLDRGERRAHLDRTAQLLLAAERAVDVTPPASQANGHANGHANGAAVEPAGPPPRLDS